MAALTKADCQALSSEFTAVSDATWTLFLTQSLTRINPVIYGSKANTAQAYLTLHELKVMGFGVATYDATGKLTSGNTTPAAETEGLDATVYGRQYLKIQQACGVGAGGIVWQD